MTATLSPEVFPALGTTAVVVVADPAARAAARRAVDRELDAVDRACSRFREDSELSLLNRAGGRSSAVSPLLLEAVEVALRAARVTDGLVDPTVGAAMRLIGYDRDFASVAAGGGALVLRAAPVPGWRLVHVDRASGRVQLAGGAELDLGATAKALCADRAAAAAAAATGSGVMVGLGGDIAVTGPPPAGGWRIRVADHHAAPAGSPGQTISVSGGGVATSGTAARRWTRGGRCLHHLLDPTTGLPVESPWRTVSVAAGSCVDANTASTASMVMGAAATAWLEQRRLPARLVRHDGEVVLVAGWPEEAGPC